MSTQNLPQSQPNNKAKEAAFCAAFVESETHQKLSRRAVLGALLGLASVSTIPFIPALTAQVEALPIGPAERIEAIEQAAALVDAAIVSLEKFWSYLRQARALSPDQVDGGDWLALENETVAAMERMYQALEIGPVFERALLLASGLPVAYWGIREQLLNNAGLDPGATQAEISALAIDDPAAAAELLNLFQTRFGGVR